MRPAAKKKIVLLGMMSTHRVAGVVWQTMHYLIGFQRLGFDVYYVEAHGMTPKGLLSRSADDATVQAVSFIDGAMRRFDLGDRWAFHALHAGGECYGMSESQLKQLYRSADLIINLHGATEPLPEHYATGRLVYLETDPVELQIELYNNQQSTIDFLAPHCAFFTFGENYGQPDCRLPVSKRFQFKPTRQPIVLDFWHANGHAPGPAFTTIGNWRQLRARREIEFQGEAYHWSKHYEFLKFLALPAHTVQPLELALSSYEEEDQRLLESNGWRVCNALSFSTDPDKYRNYIFTSRGEFTVAKDQNIRLRSGWFSDRSATYLAAGRPVITQETGFSNSLPTGAGLFAFTNLAEVAQAVETVNANHEYHCRTAQALACEYFSYERVLAQLLSEVSL